MPVDMMIISFQMMYKKFPARDFKSQPFYLHNTICYNVNMKSLPNSVELLVYFVRSDFRLQGHVGEMIRTCVRNQGAHLSQKYSFILLKPFVKVPAFSFNVQVRIELSI